MGERGRDEVVGASEGVERGEREGVVSKFERFPGGIAEGWEMGKRGWRWWW